ncbi:MAG TPA: nuclear transport factor 2 family protein [Anaerolineales bacterium]|jgi:ketosteroid isomerase-like protein
MPVKSEFDPLTDLTLITVQLFNDAVNRHDLERTMELMTDDCIFENTFPAPDGERFIGQAAVRAFWVNFFETNPQAHFEFEETFASGLRAVVRWRYAWKDADGNAGHVRGVDVFAVRAGKVAEKLSYVKG